MFEAPVDEYINTSATIIPSVDILGPITRSQAQQLNHQATSFLCSSAYNIESRLLPNDLIVLWNQGKDHGGQTEHQEGGPSRIQIDVQIAYDLRFGRSTYARKAKKITFPVGLVSCPTKIGVVRNHQNTTDF
jgi:hypothetical protein